MKFSAGQELYYVCPFIFTIDKVKVDYGLREDDGKIYYIESTGAYLREEDLFDNLNEAKINAKNKLDDFYVFVLHEIMNSEGNDLSEMDDIP